MESIYFEHEDTSPPVHRTGTILSSPPKSTTIASFPPGSFLENLAVRQDGTLLVSDMLSGCVWYIDPCEPEHSQNSIELVHNFELDGIADNVLVGQEDDGGNASYSSTPTAEAIVESPINKDVFYIISGIDGKQGTWSIYELDLRPFEPRPRPKSTVAQGGPSQINTQHSATARGRAKSMRLASIPAATWLNGSTIISSDSHGHLILMAESYQGRIYSYNIQTQEVKIWLEHPLLGKITTRPPWPGVNGLQRHESHVYFTNSDRGILGRIAVSASSGDHVPEEIEVLATGCCGDDLDIDTNGNIYVATNPQNTVLKFPSLGRSSGINAQNHHAQSSIGSQEDVKLYDDRYTSHMSTLNHDPPRDVILGFGSNSTVDEPTFDTETTGPTAVALAQPENGHGGLYVVTNGGIINPLGGVVREAKVLRIELAA